MSDAGRWKRISEHFDRAMESAPGSQLEWLDAVEPDASIRDEVRELVAAHQRAEGFLERGSLALPGVKGFEEWGDDSIPGSGSSADSTGYDRFAGTIGPWIVVKELGSGGMGTVYLATRGEDQFRQVAAVKLIRAGRATQEIIRRFRRERQILASLEHPGIARMIDGGTSADGFPWLAMEYVAGEPLYDWCSRQNLGVAERLDIFLSICDAVQYAHQNLVLHRDIKPANILVTSTGRPKLLDFGIAKLLAGEDPDIPPATRTFGAPLTPEYASPEQILGSPLSTGSDVYSLGVILYELLTGVRPYGTTVTRAEVLKSVMESDPVRPSTVIRSMTGPGTSARSTTLPAPPHEPPSTLWRRLAGDLDNISLKALSKDTNRRYASASQLAEDLRRFLTGRPVTARADTWRYRTSKFVRRNRVTVLSIALTFLSLITGLSAALWQASVARRAQTLAEKRLATAHGLSKSLIFEVFDSLRVVPGTLRVQEQMLSRTTEFLDRLAEDAGKDSILLFDLASGYQRIGDITAGQNASLRRAEQAGANFRKALELRTAVVMMDSLNDHAQLDMSSSQARLAYHHLFEEGDSIQSVALFEDAARRVARVAARHPDIEGYQVRRGASLQNLAMAYAYTGQPARGREMHAASLATLRQIAARSPENPEYKARLAESSEGYARLLAELPGKADSVETLMLTAREWYEAQVVRHPGRLDYRTRAYGVNYSLGVNQLYGRRDPAEALEHFDRSLEQIGEQRRREPNDGLARFGEAAARTTRACALTEIGRLDDAEKELRTQLLILRELARTDSTNSLIPAFLREATDGLGLVEAARARRAPSAAKARVHWQAARERLIEGKTIFLYGEPAYEPGGVTTTKAGIADGALAACDSAMSTTIQPNRRRL